MIPEAQETGQGSPFRHRAFALYWWARFAAVFAVQIVSVAVGWQIYDHTRDAFLLGLVGLVQFLPSLVLVLVTGSVADRYNRRMVMAGCIAVEVLCALALFVLAYEHYFSVGSIFAVLGVLGIARAFISPAVQSLVVNLVPKEDFATAIAWNTSSWQIGTIVGPVAGGLLYGVSPQTAYAAAAAMLCMAVVLTLMIPKPPQKTVDAPASWETLSAGFRYVWNSPIVLGAISLDLFAVLLGGATALMPVFARDILDVGPWGLGLLRAAPGIGAIAMSIYLVNNPIRNHAGVVMFATVALFGAFTMAFGASTIAWVSIAALAALGAADMISVYIRETLVQLATPDAVRGRVNAVNMVFIGASNELGEFRAGTMAALIGAVPAVLFGGAGAIVVAGLWAWWFPQLRRANRLDGR
ncbi:MAG: MFS transporter [Hyphomicrobiaceae bacterium]|nr:MFS transporter [Hyphomicrobiaceae bacterium]